MPIVLKSGSLNFLEASGPVQARNGIALPLPFYWGMYCRPSALLQVKYPSPSYLKLFNKKILYSRLNNTFDIKIYYILLSVAYHV